MVLSYQLTFVPISSFQFLLLVREWATIRLFLLEIEEYSIKIKDQLPPSPPFSTHITLHNGDIECTAFRLRSLLFLIFLRILCLALLKIQSLQYSKGNQSSLSLIFLPLTPYSSMQFPSSSSFSMTPSRKRSRGWEDQRSTPHLLMHTLGTLLVSVSVSLVSTFFSLESFFLLLFLLWSFVSNNNDKRDTNRWKIPWGQGTNRLSS